MLDILRMKVGGRKGGVKKEGWKLKRKAKIPVKFKAEV